MSLTKNMGTVDRVVRLAVAAAVALLYVTGNISGVTAIVLGVVAVVFVLTSFVSFCPLYPLLGLSTRKG
jgi:hypothetical protein